MLSTKQVVYVTPFKDWGPHPGRGARKNVRATIQRGAVTCSLLYMIWPWHTGTQAGVITHIRHVDMYKIEPMEYFSVNGEGGHTIPS